MESLVRVLVLSAGGALGVNARYWLGVGMSRWTASGFPWATVTINVTGSFAIGFLAIVLAHHWPHPLARLFLVTGFLGGYTTFSTFAYDSIKLWEAGETRLSAANTAVSVAGGLAAVVLGVALARSLIGPSPEESRLVGNRPGTVQRVEPERLPSDSFLDGDVEEG